MNTQYKDIRKEASDTAKSVAENMVDRASELADKTGEKIDQAMASANQMAAGAAERGREAGRQVEAVAGNLKGAIDKSVSEQPMATLAVAAMVGFVVGALWKS